MSSEFSYRPTEIEAVERSISAERLSGYLRAAGGDHLAGIRLYETNTQLSGVLYCVLQGLEICLRNAIHRVFSSGYGPSWYDCIPVLQYPLPDRLAEAKRSISRQGKLLTPGRVVSELSLGFWTALIGRKYEKSLWVPHLHRVFPNALRSIDAESPRRQKAAMLSRADIAKRMESIRQFRIRIAHHEPILHFQLDSEYGNILEATSWICPVTAAWIETTTAFPNEFVRRPGL